MATERLLVHKSVLQPFIEALKLASLDIMGSTPMTLAQEMGAEKNHKLLKDAFDKGATIVQGKFETNYESRYQISPLIIRDVTKDMEIYYTESFGPSVSIIAVASDEEAISIAND